MKHRYRFRWWLARSLVAFAFAGIVLSLAFSEHQTCGGDLVRVSSAEEPRLWWTFPTLTSLRRLEDRGPGTFGSSDRLFSWSGIFFPELRGVPFGPFWLRRHTPLFGNSGADPTVDLVDPSVCSDSPLPVPGMHTLEPTTLAQDPDTRIYLIRQGYERHFVFRRSMVERRLRLGWALSSIASVTLVLVAASLGLQRRAGLVLGPGGLAEWREAEVQEGGGVDLLDGSSLKCTAPTGVRGPVLVSAPALPQKGRFGRFARAVERRADGLGRISYRSAGEDFEVRIALGSLAGWERGAAVLLSWAIGTALVATVTATCGLAIAASRRAPTRPRWDPPPSASSPRAIVEISAGDRQTCARSDTGSVRCWGGEAVPGRDILLGGGKATAIAAGGAHACALLDDAYLQCWAPSWEFPSFSRYPVGGPIAARGETTCANYGRLRAICWTGSPGNPHIIDLPEMFYLAGPSLGARAVCATNEGGYHCAGLDPGPLPVWLARADLGYVESVALGKSHMCAVLQGGRVRCWGEGDFGQLGRGDTKAVTDPLSPEAKDVNVGSSVAQIATGAHHTCALLTNGHVRCWGQGGYGQLGYGNRENIGDVHLPAEFGDVSVGGRVVQIVAGNEHTCARLDSGRMRCWGRGDQGQLGYEGHENVGDLHLPSEAGDVPVF